MAGIMPTVGTIIEAISEPKSPEPEPKPPKPESPVLEVYTLTTADPDTFVTVVTKLWSDLSPAVDPKTGRVNVHATPSRHAAIKKVLEQMESEVPAENQPVLEVYMVREFLAPDPATFQTSPRPFFRRRSPGAAAATASQLAETFQKIAPNAQITVNEQARSLIVWAPPADQQRIRSALETLRGQQTAQETPQLETYRLTKVDPEAALNLLRALLPEARISVDSQMRILAAVATPADQEVIRNTLKVLQPEEGGPDAPELRFYELALAMPPSLLEAIQKVAPGAVVAMDASGERLMAVATSAEHARIDKTVEHMKKTTFIEGRSNLKVYPVTPTQRKRFEAVLDSLITQLPGIKVVADAVPGELSVWAKPQQHEVLAEILAEFKRDVPDEERYQLQSYFVTAADPSGALSMLQEMYPDTKLVLDEANSRLMVWTSPSEHAAIKASLEQIQAELPPDAKPQVEVYRLRATDAASAMAVLETLVPKARVTAGAEGDSLIATAVPADHEKIQAALEKLDTKAPPEDQPRYEVYPVYGATSSELTATLQALVPGIRVTVDTSGRRLVIWATPEQHEQIKAALAKLGRGGASDTTPTVAVYTLLHADPTATLSLLQNLVPDAQLSIAAKSGNLVALAVAADHVIIRETLDQLEPKPSDPDAPVLRFHALEEVPPANLVTALGDLVPKAQITVDADNERLMVFASPVDHETIEKTIAEFESSAPGTPQLRFHPLVHDPSPDLLSALEKLVPRAQITVDNNNDRLMVVAAPADHEKIQETIREFEANTDRKSVV